MKKVKKYLAYLILSVSILLIIISSVGVLVIKLYGNDIKAYAIDILNKKLAVKVEVEYMEISIIRQFPHVSIVFENVIAYSSGNISKKDFSEGEADILFSSGLVFLRFNIIDIIRGNYKISRILAQNGELNILTDSSGQVNYHIFKKTRIDNGHELSLDMEVFKLKNFKFLFNNLHKQLNSSGNIKEVLFKGKFGEKSFRLTVIGSSYLNTFNKDGILWADNTSIDAKINLHADDSVYSIIRGGLIFNDLSLETKGQIISGSQIYTDLTLSGKSLDIQSVLDILPDKVKKGIFNYSPQGITDINLSIKGLYSSTIIPSIKAEYKVSGGKVKISGQPELYGISFNGSYSNGERHNSESSLVNLSNIFAQTGKSTFKGNIYLKNLISPSIQANIQAITDVMDINSLINDTMSFRFTRGMIHSRLKLETKLNSFSDFDIRKIISSGLSGELSTTNTGIFFNESYPEIDNITGSVNFNNDVWIADTKITSGSGDIHFTGRIDHLLKRFIHKTSSLWVQGDIYSKESDLSFLLASNDADSINETVRLPGKLFMKLNIESDYFGMGKFSAREVKTTLNYKPGFISIPSFQLKTMQGGLSGFGAIIQDVNGDLTLKTSSNLSKLDITELFETFNNFSQDFLSSQNLGGKISGSVELSAYLKRDLVPVTENIAAEADIVIENGELKDFEPMQNLSRFIEVSELEKVKFQTLKNTFIIKDSKIYIPDMDIKSSAFNLSASGEHGFDNEFDYKVKVNLSEILAKKARNKKENNEFAALEKEGERVNIYLQIYGNPDDIKIRYDRRGAAQQIKKDIVIEKMVLKSILNEELGLFKKQFSDSVLKKNKNEPAPGFILEWEEDEEPSRKPSPSGKKKKETEKKEDVIKFDWN